MGDFYKKDKVVKLIDKNVSDKIMKNKMLRLVGLIPTKKSLHLAIKTLNDRNIERILDEFYTNCICPVTISKRQEIKHLESLYVYL